MKVPCSNVRCSERRPHHESPYDKRPHVQVEVSDDWTGPYIFCSILCACEAKKFSVRLGWIHEQPGKTFEDSY